jgi:hypothetical protein
MTTTTRTMAAGSTELKGLLITAPVDISTDAVLLAVVEASTQSPAAPDWRTPTMLERPTVNTIRALLLIGPVGGYDVGPGRWRIWAKVTDDPEVPWIRADEPFRIA